MKFQSREEQQRYAQRFSEECEKITMSWNNELKEWHPYAMKALEHSNITQLNIASTNYHRLFINESHGININIVALLVNNVEIRTPREMEMSPERFSELLKLNNKIGDYWNALTEPVKKALQKEFEIMGNKPKLVTMGQA